MSKTAIIYLSKTGFTEKYAKWIAEETGSELISFKDCTKKRAFEISNTYDKAVFGSRLKAGMIEGLPKAKKMFGTGKNRFFIFTTGATPDCDEAQETLKKMWEKNLTPEELGTIPHFYLQAGLCYEKMPFMEKAMMNALKSMLKKNKSVEGIDEGMAKALEHSFDISDKKYILPVVEKIKEI